MASMKEQKSSPPIGHKRSQSVIGSQEILNLEQAILNAQTVKSGYSSPSSPLSMMGGEIYYEDIKIPQGVYNRVYEDTHVRNDRADFTVRPMEHSGPRARRLLKYVEENFSNDPVHLMDLCLKLRSKYVRTLDQEDLQLSMIAGKLSLYSNLMAGRFQVLTPVEYAKYSAELGPVFADVLKKGKSLATLSTLSKMKFIDLVEKIDEFNQRWGKYLTIDMTRDYSYDSFLNEDNLFFFKDKEVNDLKWANEPLQIDQGALEEFKRILREICQRWRVADLKSPSKSEIATWTSDSSSFSKDPKIPKLHRNIVRERIQSGSDTPFGELTMDFIMRRSIIPVAPANFRDAWEPDFDTLFTIKSISYVMRQVVQPIPYSAMYDANIAYRRKKRLLEKDSLFLMLDYKKSAITIPRQLVSAMGEVLSEVYDNIEFRYISAYENLKLYVDNKIHPTLRGVGLGNMNELYTLMQCVFGHLSKKAFNTGSIFFNDDAAYELDPKKFRKQVILIMSFIRSLGCILNFSKCMVSESTIFCEEYRTTHKIDYRKVQLLVLPMLGSLYCANTATAKRYLYSIERGLVGTGMRFLCFSFLKILNQVYEPEFGKMDHLLPYHLGGWVDFSETNFSCLAEYCLDPWQYLRTPNEQGSIPEIRRWIAYNINSELKTESILSSKARISYRGDHISNPNKDHEIFRYNDPLSDYLYGYCGLMNPKDHEQTVDDVVNYRGLHNAKPGIKHGLSQKFGKNRKRIYQRFKRSSKDKLYLFDKSAISLNIIVRSIRSMDDGPSTLSFPRCFLKESIPVEPGHNTKIIVYKKSDEIYRNSLEDLHKSMAATIDSIRSKRWYHRSDPFIFHQIWRRKKSGYLLSERKIPKLLAVNYALPIDFRVFCPNATLFIREFTTRTGRVPISWKPNLNLLTEYHMYQFKDAFELILPPDLKGEWRDIKLLYKKNFYHLRNLLSQQNLYTRSQFKAFFRTLREIFEISFDNSHEQIESVDEDILDILERYEEDMIYERLISNVYTQEDLLDDELDPLYFSDYDDDDSEQHSLEDFEILEDDSEAEDSDPGFNEIRRLARQSEFSGNQDWG
ncbi:MAG: RNA-dependent RNA polymerase [Verticillium dahliae ormycovirus 1]|nr:MAG: RNA-dependent RNA polymerase [Verticillium dahliae ormycovirus 1]